MLLLCRASLMFYIVVVRDDRKLLDDSGDIPKPNEVVGGSIPNCEIVSLLDGN
jgi:hypothetical protein